MLPRCGRARTAYSSAMFLATALSENPGSGVADCDCRRRGRSLPLDCRKLSSDFRAIAERWLSSLSGLRTPSCGVRDGAAAVHDHGKRQRHHGVAQSLGELHRPEAANQRRIVETDLCCELPYFIGLIDGDADNLQTFRAEVCLRLDEFRHLFPTRRAPGCPEIDDHHLAAPLIDALLRPVGIRKGEAAERRGRDRLRSGVRLSVPK